MGSGRLRLNNANPAFGLEMGSKLGMGFRGILRKGRGPWGEAGVTRRIVCLRWSSSTSSEPATFVTSRISTWVSPSELLSEQVPVGVGFCGVLLPEGGGVARTV